MVNLIYIKSILGIIEIVMTIPNIEIVAIWLFNVANWEITIFEQVIHHKSLNHLWSIFHRYVK